MLQHPEALVALVALADPFGAFLSLFPHLELRLHGDAVSSLCALLHDEHDLAILLSLALHFYALCPYAFLVPLISPLKVFHHAVLLHLDSELLWAAELPYHSS